MRQSSASRFSPQPDLTPLPERTPLNAKIFGRIENKDYSIEKVYIETLPGFYLSGNLYRPLGRRGSFQGCSPRMGTRNTAAWKTVRCSRSHHEVLITPGRGTWFSLTT